MAVLACKSSEDPHRGEEDTIQVEGGLSTFSPGCGLEGGARRSLFPVTSARL